MMAWVFKPCPLEIAPESSTAIETQGITQWVGTSAGLYHYADSVLSPVFLGEDKDLLAVFSLEVEQDTVWVGHSQGLCATSTDTIHWGRKEGLGNGTLAAHMSRQQSAAMGGHLWRRAILPKGGRWVSQWSTSLPVARDVFDLHIENASSMWAATRMQGPFDSSLDDGTLEVKLNESQGLPTNHVHCLLEDRWNTLWLGTSGGGVSKYYGQQFSHQDEAKGLGKGSIHCHGGPRLPALDRCRQSGGCLLGRE